MRLKVAQIDRPREHVDLRAAVVDVVFPRHLVAGETQQARQRIPEHRTADMAHMQRTGRVGGDVFDIHPLPGAEIRAAIGRIVPYPVDQIRPDRRLQPQVQEARPGDGGALDLGQRSQPRGESLGDVARAAPGGLGQDHRRVGGHVAMGGIARRFHRDVAGVEAGGQLSGPLHVGQRRQHPVPHVGEEVHRTKPFGQSGRSSPVPRGRQRGLIRRRPAHPPPAAASRRAASPVPARPPCRPRRSGSLRPRRYRPAAWPPVVARATSPSCIPRSAW